MGKGFHQVNAVLLVICSLLPHAASAQTYGAEERGIERVRSAMELQAVKIDGAFGEVWAPYNGTVSFSVADVSWEGNSQIPVEFRRSTVVRERRFWHPGDARMSDEFGGLDDWNLDLPMIYGQFAQSLGWQTTDTNPYARCSVPALPKSSTTTQKAADFWNGYRLNVPGNANRTLLDVRDTAGLTKPQTGRTYTLGTKDLWMVSCLPSTKNGYPGEGFLVESPDGLRYYMDWVVTKTATTSVTYAASRSPLVPQTNPMARSMVYFIASRIEDRFGNWVNFTFNGNNVTRIDSNDGRWINVGYTGNRVAYIDSARGRWSYAYSGNGMLAAVSRPDGSAWTYQSTGRLQATSEKMEFSDSGPATCNNAPIITGEDYAYSVTNPSGAVGSFSFKYTGLTRNNIPRLCSKPAYTFEYWIIPPAEYSYALVNKTVSGPGLATATWQYQYQTGEQIWEDQCSGLPALCAQPRVTTVTHPDSHREYFEHGNMFNVNDGMLLKQRWVSAGASPVVLRELTNEYQWQNTGQPYPQKVGNSRVAYTSLPAIENLQPIKRRTIIQGEDQYTRDTLAFDTLARDITVRRFSSGFTRTDTIQYADTLDQWVLGQPAKSTNNDTGIVESSTAYDARALPQAQWSFGNLVQEFTYHTDGTAATVKDARGGTTSLSSWKFGIPQKIAFSDGTQKSLEVDDKGDIVALIDENGNTTRYGYDVMGRVARIDYPAGDLTSWNATIQTFEQIGGTEFGVGPGHWRKSVQQGSARKFTYYDALLRPIVVREFDATTEAQTTRFQRFAHDIEGRQIYASYPSQTEVANQGVSTGYDALGRVTGVVSDSEIGDLVTLKEYLSGNRVRTVDPRGGITTVHSMAFDSPDYEQPVSIMQPLGVVTDVSRDVFGKPLSITRRDSVSGLQLTRRYVYDDGQRLCKTIDPESGSTVNAYDGTGNLIWSASGLALSEASQCSRNEAFASGRRINRTYDSHNRLKSLTFPDGQGDQQWDYTPDGNPSQITTINDGTAFSNLYTYNKRGLITSETQATVGSDGFTLAYSYDANGTLSGIRYPTGLIVDYAPNALGQATQAGPYAVNVSYHANGAIRQFAYGNGVLHSMEQNQRHLPRRSVDTGVMDLSIAYDGSGNTVNLREANSTPGVFNGNRDLAYDALDRLTSAHLLDLMTETFTYNALDNLTSKTRVSQGAPLSLVYAYDGANRLTNVINSEGATITGLAYDAQGNLSTKNGRQFKFDYGNRLRAIPGIASYQYDANGRRVNSKDSASGADVRAVYGFDGQLRLIADSRKGTITEYVTLGTSLVARVIDTQAPLAPSLIAPALSDGSHTVQWTAVASATSYELQAIRTGGSWATIFSGNATSFAVTSQPMGAITYRVRAANGGTWGAWSASVTTTVLASAGSAPVLSGASEAPGGAVALSWTAIFGAQRYVLRQSKDGGAQQITYSGADTSLAVSGLEAGQYHFTVQACDATACGAESQALAVHAFYAPGVPSISVPSSGFGGSYQISWSAVAGASFYRLWESTDGAAWILQESDGATSRQYSGKPSGSYLYRVDACNSAGCSTPSAAGTVSVIYPPGGTPQLSVPSGSSNGAYTISWNSVGWATTYLLDERVNGGGWTRIHDEGATSRSVSGRSSGNYDYRVAACNAAGCSGWSTEATVRVAIVPAIPTGLSAGFVQPSPKTTQYSASWNAVAGASSYSMRSAGGAGCNTTETFCSSTISGAPNPTGFQVRACNDFVCSDWSSPVIAEDMR
ncbi:TPA: RHS repeat protein [Stenotrophomonas maltophilia]|nr:RHS repeat protein [Stenotrophomonas maltophilia]